jgi:hypothetical protein
MPRKALVVLILGLRRLALPVNGKLSWGSGRSA